MKVSIDGNILLDVVQKRLPFYDDSAECLTIARSGAFEAVVSAHLITTLFYVVRKKEGRQGAMDAVKLVLDNFSIALCDAAAMQHALSLEHSDFEDAVVSATAEAAGCDWILTRNPTDFRHSAVPPISPVDFLLLFD